MGGARERREGWGMMIGRERGRDGESEERGGEKRVLHLITKINVGTSHRRRHRQDVS